MKKKFCLLGIVAGALLILFGILALTGALGGDTSTASNAPSQYDSGYAIFGADFYNFVANNAQEAASASRTVARNLDEISKLFKNVTGFGFICLGLLCVSGFGIVLSGCGKKKQKAVIPAAAENAVPAPEEQKAKEEPAPAEETPKEE